jgi:hypothetical protein
MKSFLFSVNERKNNLNDITLCGAFHALRVGLRPMRSCPEKSKVQGSSGRRSPVCPERCYLEPPPWRFMRRRERRLCIFQEFFKAKVSGRRVGRPPRGFRGLAGGPQVHEECYGKSEVQRASCKIQYCERWSF